MWQLRQVQVGSMWVWNNLAGDYLLSVGEKPTKDLNEALKSLSLNESIKYLKAIDRLGYRPGQIWVFEDSQNKG